MPIVRRGSHFPCLYAGQYVYHVIYSTSIDLVVLHRVYAFDLRSRTTVPHVITCKCGRCIANNIPRESFNSTEIRALQIMECIFTASSPSASPLPIKFANLTSQAFLVAPRQSYLYHFLLTSSQARHKSLPPPSQPSVPAKIPVSPVF